YHLSEVHLDAYWNNVVGWFILPADVEKLAGRPWTLISYMFSHVGIMQFISNMFWLWSFGYILQDLTGNRKLLPIYLYGGLAGAVLFILSHLIFPNLRELINTNSLFGANCSIAAVAIATTVVSPDYRIFPMISGGIPLWILTLIFILLNFAGVANGDMSTYLSYAGAAGIGYFFIYLLRRGWDGSNWINQFFDWF